MYFIGPWDLAMSLGHCCEINHPEVIDAISKVVEVGGELNVPGGILSDAENVARHLEMGFKFMTIGIDSDYLIRGCRRALEAVSKSLAETK